MVRRAAWRALLLLACGVLFAPGAGAQIYATAVSRNRGKDRAIIFRYIHSFGPGFERSAQPNRVIIDWKYQSVKGMPASQELERMYALEDALASAVERDGFATLVLVSTGENLREWIYYAKSEDEFLKRLNGALAGKPAFPIEIHIAADPRWKTYETFKAGVKGTEAIEEPSSKGEPR